MALWIAGGTGILVLSLAFALARAIAHDMRQGDAVRLTLAKRLAPMPLYTLLKQSGVDPWQYLHRFRLGEIETHLRQCDACSWHRQCGLYMACRRDSTILSFCPNGPTLVSLGAGEQRG